MFNMDGIPRSCIATLPDRLGSSQLPIGQFLSLCSYFDGRIETGRLIIKTSKDKTIILMAEQIDELNKSDRQLSLFKSPMEVAKTSHSQRDSETQGVE